MKLSNLAIDNRVTVYILIAIIVIIGFASYGSLPREAAPDITVPYVIVNVPYVGVSPSDIEGLVTQPLEKELKSIRDIKHIISNSKEGLSSIFVEFESEVDIDDAVRRVRDKINETRPSLPSDILDPIVSEINISEFPIMYVTLGGNLGLARLKKIADHLEDKFEAIPGVLSADITGDLEPEVQIHCDVNRLKGYQIGFTDVINGIQRENVTIPGGSIDDGAMDFSVRIPGEYKTTQPIENILIKMRSGRPIYLRDVAEVNFAFEDRQTYSRLNGQPVVTLAVRKRAGENLVRIADQVKTIIAEEQKNFPAGVQVNITNDMSKYIKTTVFEMENSIMTGMFLVIMILFMFFGFKNSILISTAIPLSMLVGFIVLATMNITLNFVVLFTLILVLGILVDDAVVVIENIYRHQHEYGKDPTTAAKDGVKEVAVPVITATITVISGFIPLLFWPGIIGDFMWFLPVTLIVTMSASLFTAFVISPVQSAQFINYQKEIAKVKRAVKHGRVWQKFNPFTFIYHWVDEKFFPATQRKYVHSMNWTLKHKRTTILGSVVLLVGITVLFGKFNHGIEFFPSTEPNEMSIQINMPPGTPLETTNHVTMMIEERIQQIPEFNDIEFLTANVGASSDKFDAGGKGTPNKAIVAINMKERAERLFNSFGALASIREAVSGIPGAIIKVDVQEHGPPVGAPVSIEISGDDFRMLAQMSEDIIRQIKDIEGLVDLKDDYDEGKPEIQVIVDREKAGLLEMSTGQIGTAVRTAVSGTEASTFRLGEDEYKIMVRLREDQRQSPNDIENLNITFMNQRGQLLSVPLVSVASVIRSQGLSSIRRKDQKRVVTITGDVQDKLVNDALKEIQAKLKTYPLPNGYSIKFTGETEEQDKAAAFLSKALLITILLIFMIMVTEFNSVKVPLVIMLSVPLSLIGVFIGLLATQTPFSILMTGVGIISLAGIVVRNAIILLDFMKQLRSAGMPIDEALVEAGRTRLRPIVLTAVSTILGVMPLATGIDFDWRNFHFVIGAESSDFWRPLAVAIIFGLTVSTFLTLIIIPTVYSWIEDVSEKLKGTFSKITKNGQSEPILPEPAGENE